MGNAESTNPIRNLDKRTARREYKEDFVRGIERYKQRISKAKAKAPSEPQEWRNGDLKVFVRKRPIFQHELAAGEFDVITCVGQKEVVIHDARMHADMKRQMLNHHHFVYDRVFSESVDNGFVYTHSAQPLVRIACQGGYATAMVYGQTGSGKTFTMSSIYSQASSDIFTLISSIRSPTPPTVTISMVEVAGDSIHDLLNTYASTNTRMASDGGVHIYPVVECVVENMENMMGVIQHGVNVRSTAATGVHDGSSRSHAIVRIFIQRHDLQQSGMDYMEGVLTLVDLAGSEHKIDSMYHSGDRRKETSQINASLSALKECIRHRAMSMSADAPSSSLGQHVYRKSKLTLALKTSFVLPTARTAIICTVSPASKDTEHSVNTLRHACLMLGGTGEAGDNSNNSNNAGNEASYLKGGVTTSEYIGEVNVAQIARMAKMQKKLHGEVGELKTSNGNQGGAKAGSSNVGEVSEKAKWRARKVSEMRSFNSLSPSVQNILTVHRQRGGHRVAGYQMRRMRGVGVLGGGAGVLDEEDGAGEVSDEEEEEFRGGDEGAGEVEEDIPTHQTGGYEDDFETSGVSPHTQTHAQSHHTPLEHTPRAHTPRAHTPHTHTHTTSHANTSIPTISQVYECIHLVKDMVHKHTLSIQLHAVCRLLGYTYTQVEEYVKSREEKETSVHTHMKTPAHTHTHNVPSLGDIHSVDIHNSVQIHSSARHTHTQPTSHTPRTAQPTNTPSHTHTHTSAATASTRPPSPYKRHFSTHAEPTPAPAVAHTQTPRSSTPTNKRTHTTPPSSHTHTHTYTRPHTPSRVNAPSNAQPSAQDHTHAQGHISSQEAQAKARYQEAQLKLEKDAEKKRARQERALQVVRDRDGQYGSSKGSSGGGADKLQQYQQELQDLLQVIEQDSLRDQEHRMSSAKVYGLKKQVAMLKAVIIKEERRKKEKEDEEAAAIAGGGGGGGAGGMGRRKVVEGRLGGRIILDVDGDDAAPAKPKAKPSTYYQQEQHDGGAEVYAVSELGRPVVITARRKMDMHDNGQYDSRQQQQQDIVRPDSRQDVKPEVHAGNRRDDRAGGFGLALGGGGNAKGSGRKEWVGVGLDAARGGDNSEGQDDLAVQGFGGGGKMGVGRVITYDDPHPAVYSRSRSGGGF